MILLIRFIIGIVVGFVYVYIFTHVLAPIELVVKGKRLHHDNKGSLYGIFVILPLVFFFYILNYDLLNREVTIKLLTSLLGLTLGTMLEHRIFHNKDN